jgi:hypothetical protein
VAAADARGDDLVGEVVRADWMRIREAVHPPLGADAGRSTGFFACGTVGNTFTAIGLPANAGT